MWLCISWTMHWTALESSHLREVVRVDGGEGGEQRSVGCGQRLDVGQEVWAGLLVSQGGHTHSEKPLWILSTHQNFPQHPPHQGSTLFGTSRRCRRHLQVKGDDDRGYQKLHLRCQLVTGTSSKAWLDWCYQTADFRLHKPRARCFITSQSDAL